jgi:hypothetical protein
VQRLERDLPCALRQGELPHLRGEDGELPEGCWTETQRYGGARHCSLKKS